MPKLDSCLDLDASVLNALRKMKVNSVLDLVNADTDKLTTSSMSAKEVLSLKHKLVSQCAKHHESGLARYSKCLKKSAVLPTHIKSFDGLLNGGIETGYLYEVVGLSGAGKTQLCFSIVANVVGKLRRKVYYLDSKGDFSAHRICSILSELQYSDEDINVCLERIHVYHISDMYDLTSTLHSIQESLLNSGTYDCRLLILDSITSLFIKFVGSTFSNEGYSLLMEVGSTLKKLAREMNLAVIVTNLAIRYSDSEGGLCPGPDQEVTLTEGTLRPAMGRAWGHVPHTRLSLQRSPSSNACLLTIAKSNCYPINKSTTIYISSQGIT